MIKRMHKTLAQAITNQKKLRSGQIDQLIKTAAQAKFPPNLLRVDPPLWGSFWQFDVLAPGSSLPAIELALLRAIRLDQTWPADTGFNQFLADLQAAIAHPETGIWSTELANQPCAVFTAPLNNLTVVWYCLVTGCLHAGYRTHPAAAHFTGLTLQRSPGFPLETDRPYRAEWLSESLDHYEDTAALSLSARLDRAILRWRLK